MRRALLALFVVVGACSRSGGQPAAGPQTRTIEVAVHVTEAGGGPVAGMGVVAETKSSLSGEVTGPGGDAVIALTVPVDCAGVTVDLGVPPRRAASQIREETKKQLELQTRYTVQSPVKVALTSAARYEVAFTLRPAVVVRGRLVVPPAARRSCGADIQGRLPFGYVDDETGRFEIGRVAKNEAATLVVTDATTGAVVTRALTAAQLSASVDLGDIPVPDGAAGTAVAASVTDMAAWNTAPPVPLPEAVCFVAPDGSVVREGEVRASGEVCVTIDDPCQLVRLPPGTYYVCPGGAWSDWALPRVQQKLRAGQAAAVDASGLPNIVVGAQPAAPVNLSIATMVSPVRQLRGD